MKDKEEVKKKKTVTKKKVTKEESKKEKKTTAKKEAKVVKETKKEKVIKEKKVKEPKEDKVIKEVKEDALLDKKSQKYLRTLSKVVSILAKIGRICLMIVIPFIFIAMIALPFLMKKLDVNGNIIKFDDATIIINDDYVTFKVANSDYVSNVEHQELTYIANFLTNNTKGDILLICEVSLVFIATIVIINIYVMMYAEKLFKNISEKKTPFIEENANYIRRIGHTLIIMEIVLFVFSVLLAVFFPRIDYIENKTSIFSILIVFIIYYVFEYAVKLQEKKDTKIYD